MNRFKNMSDEQILEYCAKKEVICSDKLFKEILQSRYQYAFKDDRGLSYKELFEEIVNKNRLPPKEGKNILTGNKDTDFLILQQLSDKDLEKVCIANKYVNTLCGDNNFWFNRILVNFKFLNTTEVKNLQRFLGFKKSKDLYIYLVSLPLYTVSKLTRTDLILMLQDEQTINDELKLMLSIELPTWVNEEKFYYQLRRTFPYIVNRLKYPFSLVNAMDASQRFDIKKLFEQYVKDKIFYTE